MSTTLTELPLYKIAGMIKADWKKVNYAAKPYLDAMSTLESMESMYHHDTAYSVVSYFLCNASAWRGEIAKSVKAELNRRLKSR